MPLLRRGDRIDDEVTSYLVRNGAYHLQDVNDDEESRRFHGPVTYSLWGAMKYTFMLSLLLWWLPIFGQMIAGYVGGRRAGSPSRGAMAALVPVCFIFTLSTLARWGLLPTLLFGVSLTPEGLAVALGDAVPATVPYTDFVKLYLSSFFRELHSASTLGMECYVTTLAFAYIGGALSLQNRREMERMARMCRGSSTTIVVENPTSGLSMSRRQASFSDMTPMSAERQESEPLTFRAARRLLGGRRSEEVRPVRDKAREMMDRQREVERRVRDKTAEERGRGGAGDWEFV